MLSTLGTNGRAMVTHCGSLLHPFHDDTLHFIILQTDPLHIHVPVFHI